MSSIPISAAPHGRSTATRAGRFVQVGDVVVLTDFSGETWPIEWVQICQGSWGFNDEGIQKLPRPAVYDDIGKEIVKGDHVLIDFLHGNPKLPIVRGGVRSLSSTDFLKPRNDSAGSSPNRLAGRLRPLNAAGEQQAVIEWEAAYDDRGTFRLSIGRDMDTAARFYVSLDADRDELSISTSSGSRLVVGKTDVAINTSGGDWFTMQADKASGITMIRQGGAEMFRLSDGKATTMAAKAQVFGSEVQLGNGNAAPGDPYILSGQFFSDLAAVLSELAVGVATAPSGVAPLATAMATKLTLPTAANIYLSKVIAGH